MFATVLTLLCPPAEAASSPDLTTSISAPTGVYVYDSGRWNVSVTNSGNRDAAGVVVTIQLPVTNTSPQVYVMGVVGAKSATCSTSGTKLVCNVGTVKRTKTSTVWFDITLPESAGTLDFSATASTTTAETNTGNNGSTAVASLLNYTVSPATPLTVNNRHCTGTNLESFYECELFPSSLSEHTSVLEADGTISFPDYPDYGGTWSVVGEELAFTITSALGVEAEFVGYGVSATCWEGLTTFPGSTYVSPYEVCPL